MDKTVQIFRKSDDKFIGSYPMQLRGLNYTPAESEFLDLAFAEAVEDGLVEVEDRSLYRLELQP